MTNKNTKFVNFPVLKGYFW